jgi:hypothetical protein
MLIECKGITKGIGIKAWGAPYQDVFIILLGKQITHPAQSSHRADMAEDARKEGMK